MVTSPTSKNYDLIIIGAGPAGLTAGIYAARYQIRHLIISENIGGMAQEAWQVENYPGFISITGKALTDKIADQAKKLGSEIFIDQVGEITRQGKIFALKTLTGKQFQTKGLILSLGTKSRQLNIPGEEKFLGRGVSYCFTCDGIFFRNKMVAVVGGGNAAANAALALAQYTKKVYILVRRDQMRAQTALVERVSQNKKIEILYNTEIAKLEGKDKLEKIILKQNGFSTVPTNHKTNYKNERCRNGRKSVRQSQTLSVDGLFIEIGSVPANTIINQLGVELDEKGYIKVDTCQKTNIPGAFAAGSITSATCYLNQIVVAAAQGAVAAHSANLYLRQP